jgi:hypothetical protein
MSFAEKARVVAVSVVVSLLVGGGLYEFFKIRQSGDDSPILIAGGSLYLGTDLVHQLKSMNDEYLLLAEPKGDPTQVAKVTSLEVTDSDDNVKSYPASGATRIELTYGSAFYSDKVTLEFDPRAYTIKISDLDGDKKHPLAHSPAILPNLRMHPRRGGGIKQLSVYPDGMKEEPVKCDKGDCSVIVHTSLK